MEYGLAIIGFVLFLLFVLIVEILHAKRNLPSDFVNPTSTPHRFGQEDRHVHYTVMGDSTAAGHEHGLANNSAQYLADTQTVIMRNVSHSGAKMADVLQHQLSQAVRNKPDLVLISTGANDVTSLARPSKAKEDLRTIIDCLVEANCHVKIVITGAPDMGSVPRFAQPLRLLVGLVARRYNRVVLTVADENNITVAPIASQTGGTFRRDRSLFADDNFHPNEKGYAMWSEVINTKLVEALNAQSPHCGNDNCHL